MMVATMPNGASRSTVGAGTWRTTRSNSARQVLARAVQRGVRPALAAGGVQHREVELFVGRAQGGEQVEDLRRAPRPARASARSTLLTTTIGCSPRASALPTTNLVCGSTPSAASTSTMAPSTMFRMRSTSPPKSAWPGVSTMLMRVPRQTTEVHLARMVMPRSRSRSLRSSARSATTWWSRNEPDWLSSLSTRVVLPWSTWAMIAMLRISMGAWNAGMLRRTHSGVRRADARGNRRSQLVAQLRRCPSRVRQEIERQNLVQRPGTGIVWQAEALAALSLRVLPGVHKR